MKSRHQRHRQHHSVSYWPVVNLVGGVWLIISTSLAAGNQDIVWNDVMLGIGAIITAIVALSYERVGAHQQAGLPGH